MNNQNGFPHGGNYCLTSAALAEGTTAATIQTTASLTYAINGVFQTAVAATNNISMALPTPTGARDTRTQSENTVCNYALFRSASAFQLRKGNDVSITDYNNGIRSELPAAQSDEVMVGYVRVTATAVTFLAGTTDLSAAGITAAYFNTVSPPATPV